MLKYRSDIVISEVITLKTKNSTSFKLPSKGYAFDKPYVLIELKLRRNRKGSDNKFRKKIEEDRAKINRIREDMNNTTFYSYLIAFDKKGDINFDCKNSNFSKEFYISMHSLNS